MSLPIHVTGWPIRPKSQPGYPIQASTVIAVKTKVRTVAKLDINSLQKRHYIPDQAKVRRTVEVQWGIFQSVRARKSQFYLSLPVIEATGRRRMEPFLQLILK